MKTLYQIVCFESENSLIGHSYSRVYEDKQQAEKILARKREIAPSTYFELREVKLVIEFKSEQIKDIVYGMADTKEGLNILKKLTQERILADNAIKIEDDELDNNKPCGCEAHKICLMCFDD